MHPLPLFRLGMMEEWSLAALLTSLSEMLLTVWNVWTGSLEATLQLFTLTHKQRRIHTEKCHLKTDYIYNDHIRLNTKPLYDDLTMHCFRFLQRKKKNPAELLTWTELHPSRLSHSADASAVPTSPSLEEHATPKNT